MKDLITMANHLGISREETTKFLEKALEAKKLVNELTGITWADGVKEHLDKAYRELDELLSPICSKCDVRAKRFITSSAQLYDPEIAQYPGGSSLYWTGEWYCPKCKHLVAVGERWWIRGEKDQE